MKFSGKNKILCSFFLVIIFWFLPVLPVHADMGPKPSIAIEVVNEPEEYYYLDLLVYREGEFTIDLEAEWNKEIKEELEREDQTESDVRIKKTLIGYNEKGWHPWLDSNPIGKIFHPRKESGTYFFDYRVPRTFRVILVTESGEIYTSNKITKKFYDAKCVYDVQTGTIEENTKTGLMMSGVQVLICFLFTIAVEYGVLVWFHLQAGRNLIIFFLANIVTQFALQYIVMYKGLTEGFGLSYLSMIIPLEILVILFEMLCYIFTLRGEDGAVHWDTNMAYALGANILSFVSGWLFRMFLMLFVLPLLM